MTPVRNIFNLLAVMAICGLWHGAGMSVHRLFKLYPGNRITLPKPLAVALTFHFVAVG